jgi:hypothetical protein
MVRLARNRCDLPTQKGSVLPANAGLLCHRYFARHERVRLPGSDSNFGDVDKDKTRGSPAVVSADSFISLTLFRHDDPYLVP